MQSVHKLSNTHRERTPIVSCTSRELLTDNITHDHLQTTCSNLEKSRSMSHKLSVQVVIKETRITSSETAAACWSQSAAGFRLKATTHQCLHSVTHKLSTNLKCGPILNVMAALPNIGGALCSTPQFGWRPLLECRAVKLPRRETRWNYLGCPKLTKRSQPLVGRSSPYCEEM